MTCDNNQKTRSVNEWSFIDENDYQYLLGIKSVIGALLYEQNEIPICQKKELKN